jgi:hypothetical protein
VPGGIAILWAVAAGVLSGGSIAAVLLLHAAR